MRLRKVLIIFAAAFAFVAVADVCRAAPPTWSCSFNSAQPLSFGNLDPSSAVNRTATATVVFTCTRSAGGGSTNYTITEIRSPNYLGGYRLQNAVVSSEYIPYTFTYPGQGAVPSGSATSGVPVNLTITGTIQGINYADAYMGPYSDWVQLNITP